MILKSSKILYQCLALVLILVLIIRCSPENNVPFKVKDGLFNQQEPYSLGLTSVPGAKTISIYKATPEGDCYVNGVVMTAFKEKFYCQWQSSEKDEDSPDTWVAYSSSEDGENWAKEKVLAASIEDGYCSSGGWWQTEDSLIAYIHIWPENLKIRGGYTCYTASADGENWTGLKPVLMASGDTLKAIIEQDPAALASGRIIAAAHFQPGLIVSPIYTEALSGVRGWKRAKMTNLPADKNVSREIEPSWYRRRDEALVMVFRDQESSYKKLASISFDDGVTWTTPVLTNMPDSRSKQSAGNLPDGRAYLIGNPVENKQRSPLVITLSQDGKYFDLAYAIRKGAPDLPDLMYPGKYKREGYHYPKTMLWKDTLYISYATNKERVEFTQIPVKSLKIK